MCHRLSRLWGNKEVTMCLMLPPQSPLGCYLTQYGGYPDPSAMTTIIDRVTPLALPYSFHRRWKNARNTTYWKRERDPWTKDCLTHHPLGTMTVSTPSEHVFQCARSVPTTMFEMQQNLGTWYSCPQNQVLVNMRLKHAMMTPGSGATRIRQTREQGHQEDDTDLCGTALMLGIRITIISSVRERNMAFNIHSAHVMVIAHLDLPYKQHWIGVILFSHTAGTAYSTLEPGDEEHRRYPLIASNTPSGRRHIADDRNNDCQVRGYSSALASVIALQPTSALIPTPSSDDRNIKRHKLCCCWRRAPNGTFRSADISIEAHVMRLSRRQCLAAYFLRLMRPAIHQKCQFGAKVPARCCCCWRRAPSGTFRSADMS